MQSVASGNQIIHPEKHQLFLIINIDVNINITINPVAIPTFQTNYDTLWPAGRSFVCVLYK